jgi:hypothetical protein
LAQFSNSNNLLAPVNIFCTFVATPTMGSSDLYEFLQYQSFNLYETGLHKEEGDYVKWR